MIFNSTFTFFPFGKEAVNRRDLTGVDDIGTGSMGTLGNVLWFVFIGWWLALGHIFSAVATFMTVIGIPFGIQHLKLARIALSPIGLTIVTKEVARNPLTRNAEPSVGGYGKYNHFTDAVDDIKQLKREKRDVELERLLNWCIEQTEAESRREAYGVAPYYYAELALVFRKRKDLPSEIEVLHRYAGQKHAPGAMPEKLLERLEKAEGLLARAAT